jgi:EmrB/QacA subfamily drug resistance transporter
MSQSELRRPVLLAAVMVSSFMIAIEATIVSTGMPQIAAKLGGLNLYAWVFSSFLLTQTATTVLFGKLADTFGRRPILLVGIAVFLVGSLLCGLATTMPWLIAFRLVQGVGAGAIQPVSITVIGDLYTTEERARIQGWLASVWGISSVLGPLAGGLIVQYLSWPWVFWINLPIGVAAAVLFGLFLRERIGAARPSLDIVGALLFITGIAALMVALTKAGSSNYSLLLPSAALTLACAAMFVWQERRAEDPMIAFGLWSRRSIAATNAATLFSGVALIGLNTFLPMYVQGVLGRSPTVAGFTLTATVLGWPIGATIAARLFIPIGLRRTMLIGASLIPIGAVAFVVVQPGMSPIVPGIGSVVLGLGMGFLSNAGLVLVQGSVDWSERGSATASVIFARSLGSTLGATVLGTVLNLSLAAQGTRPSALRRLLDAPGGAVSDPALRMALANALHLTFWAVLAVAVCTLLFALLVPDVPIDRGSGSTVLESEELPIG